MLDVKQAAMNADDYLHQLYAEQLPSEVQLEEVEMTDDEKHWMITMSFVPQNQASTLPSMLRTPKRRYKQFKIDAETGRVLSMKIRNVEAA